MDKQIQRRAFIRNNFQELQKDLETMFDIFHIKIIFQNLVKQNKIDEKKFELMIVDDDGNSINYSALTNEKLVERLPALQSESYRSFINDLYLVVGRYAFIIHHRLLSEKKIAPEHFEEKFDLSIANLNRFLDSESKRFLDFFRKLRNSTVHYDAHHNEQNALDYTIGKTVFKTTEQNVGKKIRISLEATIKIYEELKTMFEYEKLVENPRFFQELSRK